jgi:hypothetical protein
MTPEPNCRIKTVTLKDAWIALIPFASLSTGPRPDDRTFWLGEDLVHFRQVSSLEYVRALR